MAYPSLLKLSTEMVVLIGEHLNAADRSSFSRVCRKLCADTIKLIFSELEVSYLPTSFENLLNIASTPNLNTSVSHLFYNGRVRREVSREVWEKNIRFPGDKLNQRPSHPTIPADNEWSSSSLTEYALEVNEWTEECTPTNFYLQTELDAGFQAYNNEVEAAKTFEHSYVDFTSLAASMKQLKHLRYLFVTTNQYRISWKHRKPSRCADLVTACALRGLGDWTTDGRLAIRQTTSVLQAVFLTLPKLEALGLHQIPWFVVEEQFGQGIHVGAFTHIRLLSLEVSDYADGSLPPVNDYEKRQKTLGKALQSMKGLEDLRLTCVRRFQDRNDTTLILWSRIFGDTQWLDLKELHVYGMDMEASWLEFFPRHPKIRSLYLAHPFLLEHKSWVAAFHRLKTYLVQPTRLSVKGTFWFTLDPDENEDDIKGWRMDSRMKQLGGSSLREDDRLNLGEHIENWFLKNGPDPFMEENLAEKFRVNENA